MSIRLLSAALAVCCTPAFTGAQEKGAEEHPFKTAKVGDWATYTMVTAVGGMEVKGSTKVVVAAKDDKNVTLKTTAAFNGKEFPAQESKVDLTKPYDPLGTTTTLPKGADVKVEKAGEGKEKIKVGGKEYDTTWMKMKAKVSVMKKDAEFNVKVWLAKDVPLGGMVKMEMTSEQFSMTMELKETGTDAK